MTYPEPVSDLGIQQKEILHEELSAKNLPTVN